MSRLKGRDENGKADSELVTREDGSQAMRVRKRRRRTTQTNEKDQEVKRNEKLQIIQVIGIVVLVLIVGVMAGVGILYANSSFFRNALVGKIEASGGGKAKVTEFRMNPVRANAGRVILNWGEGNVLGSLDALAISAKIAPVSFLGKVFKGEEMVGEQGDLILKSPREGAETGFAKDESAGIPIRFDRFSIPRLNVFFGGEKNVLNCLEKTEGSLFPGGVAGKAELRLTGGLLKKEGWPLLALDRAYVVFRGSEVDVKSMRFEIPRDPNLKELSRGFMELSGKFRPLDAGEEHTLDVELRTFRLSYLLGADLGRFFLGRLDTDEVPDSNYLLIPTGSKDAPRIEISATNALDSRIDLGGFKFLLPLAAAVEDRWYELPNFDDAVAMKVSRQGEAVEIKNFTMESRGRMAIRGTIQNGEAGKISGTIRIGLPEGAILNVRNKRLDTMFGQVREGYRWVELEIGGTSALPTDNFLDLYNSAEPVVEEAVKAPDTFEGLIEGK